MAVLKRFTSSLEASLMPNIALFHYDPLKRLLIQQVFHKHIQISNQISNDPMIVHLKTGWLEAHFIGFIGKKRKELSN